MKQENLSYLVNTLEILKFEALANGPLETAMKLGKERFNLKANIHEPDDTTDFNVKFSKKETTPGELGEYYFLNGIDTTHVQRGKEPVQYEFTVFAQRGYNAYQMRNLMQGRSVYSTYYDNKNGRQVELYRRIDFTAKDENGKYIMRTHYPENNGFSMENELKKLPLITNEEDFKKMVERLKDGERVTAIAKQGMNRERVFLEARPHNGNIAVFNERGERMIIADGRMRVHPEQQEQGMPEAAKQIMNGQQQDQQQQQQSQGRRKAG